MVKKVVVITEDDLEQQFKEDKKFAVQLLDSEYREHLWRYIKSKCGTSRRTTSTTCTKRR